MKNKTSLILLGTLALGMMGTAVAQDRDNWRYSRDGYYDQDYGRGRVRYGFDNGFQEGQQAGREDALRRIRFRATDHGAFRNGMDGYRGGDREEYQEAFRAGYMRGYRQAYGDTMQRYRWNDHHRDGDGDWDDR